MSKCPICNQPIITPLGKGEILILGFEPEEEDIPAGQPFINRSGGVLKKELAANKIDWRRLRLDYLWGHPPAKAASRKKVDQLATSDLNEKCYNHFFGYLMGDVYKAVLLLGAEVTKQLTDCSVSEWAGIPMKSDYFDGLVLCCPKPSQVFSVPLGEVRLSVRKFCKQIRQLGFYE